MRLDKHAIDLFEVHDAGLVTDGFDQCAETEIASAAQQSFAGADDERQRFGREGVVTETGAVQLIQDERFHRFGSQALEQRRISDARAAFLVDGQPEGLQYPIGRAFDCLRVGVNRTLQWESPTHVCESISALIKAGRD